ncbi:MAG: ribosome recycling factor [Bacillales bacterium]|nr:ribosome recycling factor [Bacillales bacterium]
MDSDTLLLECEEKMEGIFENFKKNLSQARTGRANPKMFEHVRISYYGVDTPINQVSSISVPEGNQIYIKPYDKSTLSLIEKAIFASNMGVTPQNDGTGIRIVLPPMTEENRLQVVKEIKKLAEEAKIVIRNIRQDTNGQLKKNEKDKEISEDILDSYLKDVQDLTDKFNENIDKALADKEKEVMTI